MDALRTMAEWVAIVIGGLVVRAAIFAAVLGAVVVVLLPVVYAFEGGRRLLRRLRGIENVQGFEWRRGLRYAPAHLWVRERGRVVRIGIDSVAARIVGRSERVELPFTGQHVAAGDVIATLVFGHSVVAVPAPIAGIVAGVNGYAEYRPDVVSREPHAGGWLVDVRPDSTADVEALLRGDRAREWFTRDATTLNVALEHAAGYAAADGGVPIHGHPPVLEDAQRHELARGLLHFGVIESANRRPTGRTQPAPGVRGGAGTR